MSKYDLRDISQRLSGSRDTEGVVFEFLGYLQSIHPDWHASLTFYEVSRDALVSLYERKGNQLVRRDVSIAVDRLPARLVRKFFHPSAFFNAPNRRSLLSQLFQASPFYEPDPTEAPALAALAPSPRWESCVCLPLADREDILALLVLVSPKKNAFGARVVGDLIPVKSMAALALAQHLYRNARPRPESDEARAMVEAASDFHERIRRLDARTTELTDENHAKAERLRVLTAEIEQLDRSSSAYKQELTRVKGQLQALEEQSAAASEHLSLAYTQLNEAQGRMTELQRTVGFLKDVFQVLAEEHDGHDFTATMVAWFSEHFGVERCSLMVLDTGRDTLRIAAHRGLDAGVAGAVKVRVGQGISGWVAQNRKPLFIRVKSDAQGVQHTGQDAYNSDSFISVPLIHRDRLAGVLNLSNKHDGAPFDELDLDRAQLAGSLLAMSLGAHDVSRRAAAWA
jgi:putative methionine-R-sulfoxide reductase with GAF domain